ncbi:hypothetical protein MNBD_GAMMA09-2732 [hydrothermal vent metagenome]|uniref:Periplasmic chaperone PpiD n=1 Tax=hydrothermal vent metagenome TaxID=652676 RepID=A0A3B0XVX4_9ZZZZ
MLQSIHDKAKGVLGIFIVVLIGLTFALFGINDYLTGATEKFAARVDGVEISQSEFEQGMTRQRQRLEEMFQGKVPDSPIFQQRMKEQVLEQLITQRVLKKAISDEGYRVSNQMLAQKIKNMEAFQQDGSFDAVAYQAIIQGQGMAIKEFENLYRSDLGVQQFQDGILRSSVVGPGELNILYQIQQQSRDISYLQFDDSQYEADTAVTEDQIRDYFEANKARFMSPEMVSISYVELKSDDLMKDIVVDDAAIKELYDNYVSSIKAKEQRKARHILINVSADADDETRSSKKATAEGLLKRINAGESFEALAKASSDDPGSSDKGGDLGWINKGGMTPEFEASLFKLKKGETSKIVESEYGYHIIHLDDIKSGNIDSFELKKSELIKQHQAQAIEDRFYEKSELMATIAYENDQSLQDVADALGTEIKTLPAFSRFQGTGIATNDKVRQAAFDSAVINEGRNSEIIEIDRKHAVVLRLDVHTDAKPKALEEVKAQITAALKAQGAREKAQAAALAALVLLEQGKAIDAEEVKSTASLVKVGSVKRDNKTLNQQVLQAAFTMVKPKGKPVYKVLELATGAAVLELKSVSAPAPASDEQLQVLSRQFQNEQANRDMEAVLSYLKSKAEIVRQSEL